MGVPDFLKKAENSWAANNDTSLTLGSCNTRIDVSTGNLVIGAVNGNFDINTATKRYLFVDASTIRKKHKNYEFGGIDGTTINLGICELTGYLTAKDGNILITADNVKSDNPNFAQTIKIKSGYIEQKEIE